MYFTSWMDNKSVNLLSSYPTEWTPIERRAKDKNKNYQLIQLKRPTLIGEYNQGMGGTDKHDQLNGYYRTSIKTLQDIHAFPDECGNKCMDPKTVN